MGHHEVKNNLLADNAKSSLFEYKNKGKSMNRREYMKIMGEQSTVQSKKEYLLNRTEKPSSVINMRPEKSGFIDKRMAERDFYTETELSKSVKIAKDAKAMRLNRRQMFKNAPLEDSYEPLITTKQVS